MSDKPLEFLIECSVTGESGKVTAIGRCGDVAIPKNATFTVLYRNKKREYPHGLENPAERETERSVRLSVEAITAYGKKIDQLPAGTTGCLVFDTRQTDLLPCGWILSSG